MGAEKIVPQAAAIPYRPGPLGGFEVLLVSRSGGGGWGVPKGRIESGRTPERTARLESMEEAGVLGRLRPALGSYSYSKRGRRHEVEVFPLCVERLLSRWEEEERRIRVWVPLSEAARLVGPKRLRKLLTRLRHRLIVEAEISGTVRRAA